MRLYLDDDSVSALLTRLLRAAAHDVRLPADVGLAGSPDPVHFRHAIREDRVLLSGNHDDFRLLHLLVLEAHGRHPGALIVRRDNDPRRDLTPRGIVRAIANLVAASVPVADQFLILNHRR
jgi:predicted nuclease of predicted toxin-antitoxin system